jgi:hypothetical protein
MSPHYSIALNFLQVNSESFSFTVYRLEDLKQSKADLPPDVVRQTIPINSENLEERKHYWVSLKKVNGFESFKCRDDYNQYLTRDFLHDLLLKSCRNASPKIKFDDESDFAIQRVSFTLKTEPEGEMTIWLQAYYLKSVQKFGFLIDFRFKKKTNIPFSKRVQQLSLSLDQYGRENKSFYSDRYDRVQEFINTYFNIIFPLRYEENVIEVSNKLIDLPANTLDKKQYLFCDDHIDNSQFMGLKHFRPLASLDQKPYLFFVYRQHDRSASLELYKALRGETFPNLFQGTEKMFGFPVASENVTGIAVSGFQKSEMERVRDTILNSHRNSVLVILIAPWNNDDEEDSQEYFRAKYVFVNAGIPSQVVRLFTVEGDTRLQWSISNIALQCFSKLGGKPWKVKSKHSRCLIIGIGQSHREVVSNGTRRIERYYAYSVLTESSGLFRELRMLGRSQNRNDYLTELKKSVERIVIDNRDSFDRFVIHAPYKIRRDELQSIQEAFSKFGSNQNNQFVVLRINTNNDFFGYSPTNNSLVPFESTYVSLAWDEYLVWFEGLQYQNPKAARRYSRPVHIVFHYSNIDLSPQDRIDYLQDAVNLSGANWRGFNAKSIPVSIYYAQLIARFTNRFDELGLPEVSLENLHPWFL